MNPLNWLRRKQNENERPYEWPKPTWKKIVLFPRDVFYFHMDLLRNAWEFLRWICFTKPKCLYCDSAANAGLAIKRNALASRYANLWMAQLLCSCTEPPDAECCPVPFCRQEKRKRFRVIPLGLVTLAIWLGAAYGASQFPPARKLARTLLPTQQLKQLVQPPMKNPLERARTAIEEKNYLEARIAYMNAVRQDPSNGVIRAEFADALLELKLWGQALKELHAATTLNPTNQIAVAQYIQLATLTRQAERALPAAKALAAGLPNEVQPQLLLAMAYAANEEKSQAIAILENLQNNPDLTAPEAFQSGAMAMSIARDHEQAQRFYERSLALEPDNLTAYIQLTKLHRLAGRREASRTALAEAAALDPGHYDVLAEQAEQQLAEGQLNKALATMKRAYERNASWGYLKARLAEVMLLVGQYDEAKQLAEELKEERAPMEKAMGFTVLAQIYMNKQLYPDAEEAAASAIELDGSHHRQHTILARARMARGNYEGSREALDQALERAPGLLEIRFLDAQQAYAQKDLTNGLARLENMVADTNLPTRAVLQIAGLAFQHKQFEPARMWFDRVYQADNENALAAHGLIRSNLELGVDAAATRKMAADLAKRFPESLDFAIGYARALAEGETPVDDLPEIEQIAAHFAFHPSAHYYLGKAYYRAERKAEARKELEAALKMAPQFPEAESIHRMLERLP